MSRFSLITLLLLLVLNAFDSSALITERRQFQLDSISTNIPKTIRNNFDSVHAFLHRYGNNDEERVWLFYGYIGTHFKYDQKRKRDKKDPPFYSPAYTAQKRSGVCRDFAGVFKALCDKSGIPCMEVSGKTISAYLPAIGEAIVNFVTLHPRRPLGPHAWNVVKVNEHWQFMDPTWTSVEKTVKLPICDPTTKQTQVILVRSVNREYYNPEPAFMMRTHVPFFPAFLLAEKVPTYKSALRKTQRQHVYAVNYPFAKTIDSMYTSEHPYFSVAYHRGCRTYSKRSDIHNHYKDLLALPFQKSGKYNQPTIDDYNHALKEAKMLTDTLYVTLGLNYKKEYLDFAYATVKKRTRLEKQKAEAEKKRTKR